MREKIEYLFKGTPSKESVKRAIQEIDNHLNALRSVSMDPRVSQKMKFTINELKLEREKLLEKLRNI